jgi:hypothetical protein
LSRGDVQTLCRRAGAAPAGDRDLPAAWLLTDDRNSRTELLQSLGRRAFIGHPIPDFSRWPWYSRRLARLAARCILFLARFLLTRQSQFNTDSLNLLHNLSQQQAEIRIHQVASVRRLELHLQEQMNALEARIAVVQSELARMRRS